MFTPKNLKTLALVTNLAWYSGVVPYYFKKDRTTGNLHVVCESSKSRIALLRATFSLNTFYILFLTFRVFKKVFIEDEEASLAFLVKMGYLFSAYTLPVVLQINTLRYWQDTTQFYIQYIRFFKKIQRNYLSPSDKGSKCMKFFSVVILIGTLVTIQNIIIILKKPYQDHFLTSILENPKEASFLKKLPLLGGSIWIWANTWTNIWVFCFHQYIYITCGIFVSKELDVDVKHPRTSRHLRDPRICAKTLRSMQTLHRMYQNNFQQWFCPTHKATAVCIATSSLYGVIKLSGPRSIIMGFVAMMSLLYLSTLFYKFGKFYEIFERTLQNWKQSQNTTKYMKKVVMSIPVLRVRVGSFYSIKKTTVIMVLYTVLNNTITLFFL